MVHGEFRRLSETKFWARYPTEAVVVTASHVHEARDALHAELRIEDVFGTLLHYGRVNLLAGAWKRQLAQALAKQRDADWAQLLEDFCLRVVEAWRKPPEVLVLAEVAPVQDEELWHVWPLVANRTATVLYGDGGVGKSGLALALALSMASGVKVLPGTRLCRPPVPVLYLDWEDDPAIHRVRLERICAGLGIGMPRDLYYMSCAARFVDLADAIEEEVLKRDIGAIVIDSLAPAAGEDAWQAEPNLEVFRAIRRLDVTALVNAHVAKQDLRDGQYSAPYGSVFVRNAARCAWEVRAAVSSRDDGAVGVMARMRKNNRGPLLSSPLLWAVRYSDEQITFRAIGVHELEEYGLAEVVGQEDMLLAAVQEMGSPTVQELAERLGKTEGSVRMALHRLRARGRVVQLKGIGEGGKAARWALRGAPGLAKTAPPTPPPTTPGLRGSRPSATGDERPWYAPPDLEAPRDRRPPPVEDYGEEEAEEDVPF